MKKTLKVNLALYGLSEDQLDNLASEFCGRIADIVGKAKVHEVVFEDELMDRDDPVCDSLAGDDNALCFARALTCFKLKSP